MGKVDVECFKGKNKKSFVDGTLKLPVVSTPNGAYWKACNFMIIQWLVNSTDKSIQPSVSYEVFAKAVWDDSKD